MTSASRKSSKAYVSKTVRSPVGLLTLIASNDGLAAILWRFRERLHLSVLRDALRMRGRDRGEQVAIA